MSSIAIAEVAERLGEDPEVIAAANNTHAGNRFQGPSTKGSKITSLYLPTGLNEKLTKFSKQFGVSKSSIARRAFEMFINACELGYSDPFMVVFAPGTERLYEKSKKLRKQEAREPQVEFADEPSVANAPLTPEAQAAKIYERRQASKQVAGQMKLIALIDQQHKTHSVFASHPCEPVMFLTDVESEVREELLDNLRTNYGISGLLLEQVVFVDSAGNLFDSEGTWLDPEARAYNGSRGPKGMNLLLAGITEGGWLPSPGNHNPEVVALMRRDKPEIREILERHGL